MKDDQNKQFRIDHYPISYHIYYWIGVVLIWVVVRLITDGVFIEPLVNKLGYLPAQIFLTYLLIYFVLPAFFRKEFVKGLLGLGLGFYLALVCARFMKVYFYETILFPGHSKETFLELLVEIQKLLGQYSIWVFLTPITTIMMLLVLNHLRQKVQIDEMKSAKNMAELKFLKAQVHPHFLFNTLNNLYSLSLQKSDKTSGVADKLHSILDYMFHRCNEPFVTIGEEAAMLKNYVDLERLRYGDRLTINTNFSFDNERFKIAPLILLSLVENAFKHGVSNVTDKMNIAIDMKLNHDKLDFYISNSKSNELSEDKIGYRKGIGVNNVKKQLNLLYRNNHHYSVEDTPDQYTVRLKLNEI